MIELNKVLPSEEDLVRPDRRPRYAMLNPKWASTSSRTRMAKKAPKALKTALTRRKAARVVAAEGSKALVQIRGQVRANRTHR
jgi:hypothetical protein